MGKREEKRQETTSTRTIDQGLTAACFRLDMGFFQDMGLAQVSLIAKLAGPFDPTPIQIAQPTQSQAIQQEWPR